MTKTSPAILRVGLLLLLLIAGTCPGHTAGLTELQVKAAVIFRLTQFVTWPDNAFTSANSPLEICIFEHPGISDALERVTGRRVGARQLVVRRKDRFDIPEHCQMLFLGGVPTERMRQILSNTSGRPVLTVAEDGAFTDMGGMITLRLVNNKVRFEINDWAARGAGLSISAKLLRLATIVH